MVEDFGFQALVRFQKCFYEGLGFRVLSTSDEGFQVSLDSIRCLAMVPQ